MTDLDQLGMEALTALFSSAYDEAVAGARAVLESRPSPTARIRAMTALTGALACTDHGPEAVGSAQQLLAELDRSSVPPGCARLAHAMVGLTGVILGATDLVATVRGADRSLLEGLRRYVDGDLPGALAPLRSAFERLPATGRLFGSETTSTLIVVLAELGHRDEARRLLADHPPGRFAMVPGLAAWSAAAVAAADGFRDEAGDLAARAARVAASRGAAAVALAFLVDAARWGEPRGAARVLEDLALTPTNALQQARVADLLARASGSATRLVEAAEIQRRVGLRRPALELAELAVRTDRDDRYERRITVLRRQGGEPATVTSLTQREREVARLAAHGLSDQHIADELVVSIRTVQSHLASSYRKLGIRSRGELVGLT